MSLHRLTLGGTPKYLAAQEFLIEVECAFESIGGHRAIVDRIAGSAQEGKREYAGDGILFVV